MGAPLLSVVSLGPLKDIPQNVLIGLKVRVSLDHLESQIPFHSITSPGPILIEANSDWRLDANICAQCHMPMVKSPVRRFLVLCIQAPSCQEQVSARARDLYGSSHTGAAHREVIKVNSVCPRTEEG